MLLLLLLLLLPALLLLLFSDVVAVGVAVDVAGADIPDDIVKTTKPQFLLHQNANG